MAIDPRQNPGARVGPNNDEGYYHDEYLKLTPEEVAAAREKLLSPTERDIVRYWETRKPQVG